MPDTVRSTDDLLNASTGLFKDNTAGDISAQDLRDFVLSTYRPQAFCQGRLTLTSGTPVTTSDVATSTDIYWTPYNGNLVGLYDGTSWKLHTFTERTLALGTLTSGLNYDVFLYDNSGTLTLEATGWSTDTARATALTTQDGVHVKTGATTRRYLGTFRTVSTTQTADAGGTGATGAQRFLWNCYNRVPRKLHACPGYSDGNTASSYTSNSTTWVAANSGTGAKAEFLTGLDGVAVDVSASLFATNSGPSSERIGIGLDSTSDSTVMASTAGQTIGGCAACRLTGTVAFGYHYAALLIAVSGGTGTFYADNSRHGGAADPYLTFLSGVIHA